MIGLLIRLLLFILDLFLHVLLFFIFWFFGFILLISVRGRFFLRAAVTKTQGLAWFLLDLFILNFFLLHMSLFWLFLFTVFFFHFIKNLEYASDISFWVLLTGFSIFIFKFLLLDVCCFFFFNRLTLNLQKLINSFFGAKFRV